MSTRAKNADGPFQAKRIEKFGVILNVLEKCFPLKHELDRAVPIWHLWIVFSSSEPAMF